MAVLVAVALTGGVVAQTTGVPGVNDFTVNGSGSGGTSAVPSRVVAESTNTLALAGAPGLPVFLAYADAAAPGALTLDASSSLDLDPGSLAVVLDGSGFFAAPGALGPFLVTDGAGAWSLALTSGPLPVNSVLGAVQMGQADPATGGVSLTQAHRLYTTETFCAQQAQVWASPPDDGDLEVTLGAPFTFYGVAYANVFLSTNGSLSFGAGVGSDFSDSPSTFLAAEPRVSVWEDFAPDVAGTVSYGEESGVFSCTWSDVPTWNFGAPGDRNTFCLSLDMQSGEVTIAIDGMDLQNGNDGLPLVGITAGGNLSTSASGVDLSDVRANGSSTLPSTHDAVFEDFGTTGVFDLEATRLTFFPSGGGVTGPYLVY